MSGEKKGMLAAIAANVIFGLSYLFSKMAMSVTEPMILLCARFSITFVVLNLLVATRVLKLNLRGKSLVGPIMLGVLQPVLYFVLENYGLNYTTTSFTGIVSSISPIFSALLGALLLKERPNKKQWLCIGISIIGVLLVSLGSTSGKNTVTGCLCLLGAYLSGAFYSVFVRRLSRRFSAFELTYIMFTVGFVFFSALAFIQYRGQTVSMIRGALATPSFVIAIIYLGAVASVGAFLLANYSISKLPVTRSTVFGSISTLVSILAGVIVMHDPFSVNSVLAIALILVGVWGVNFFAQRASGE